MRILLFSAGDGRILTIVISEATGKCLYELANHRRLNTEFRICCDELIVHPRVNRENNLLDFLNQNWSSRTKQTVFCNNCNLLGIKSITNINKMSLKV